MSNNIWLRILNGARALTVSCFYIVRGTDFIEKLRMHNIYELSTRVLDARWCARNCTHLQKDNQKGKYRWVRYGLIRIPLSTEWILENITLMTTVFYLDNHILIEIKYVASCDVFIAFLGEPELSVRCYASWRMHRIWTCLYFNKIQWIWNSTWSSCFTHSFHSKWRESRHLSNP